MLERLVFTKEVWTPAIAGRDFPDADDRSIAGLRRRLDAAGEELAATVRVVGQRGDWDAAFVDALCDPPESFTFGGVVAHVLTFSAYRRQVVLEVLGELGATGLPSPDPNQWERGPRA